MQIPESPHNSSQRLSIATHSRVFEIFSAKIYNFPFFFLFFAFKIKNTFQLSLAAESFAVVNVKTKENKRKFTKLVAITFQQKNRHLAHCFF